MYYNAAILFSIYVSFFVCTLSTLWWIKLIIKIIITMFSNQVQWYTDTINNKAIIDHTSPALCTANSPFPTDSICSERCMDGMIPSAAWCYWRSSDPFGSERVTMQCQWGRKPKNCPFPLGFRHPARRRPSHGHAHRQHAQKNWWR